jgi:hypothetical protein
MGLRQSLDHAVPGTALRATTHGAGCGSTALLANILGVFWHRRLLFKTFKVTRSVGQQCLSVTGLENHAKYPVDLPAQRWLIVEGPEPSN